MSNVNFTVVNIDRSCLKSGLVQLEQTYRDDKGSPTATKIVIIRLKESFELPGGERASAIILTRKTAETADLSKLKFNMLECGYNADEPKGLLAWIPVGRELVSLEDF